MVNRRISALACFALLMFSGWAAADDRADARAIIDRAIEFSGGRDALARYEKPFVRVAEGTISGFGRRQHV